MEPFLQRTAQTAAAAASQWFHCRSRKHPQVGKGYWRNTTKHTATHTYTQHPQTKCKLKVPQGPEEVLMCQQRSRRCRGNLGWVAEGTGLGDVVDTWTHAAFFEEGSSERERDSSQQFSGLETERCRFRELRCISF